MRRRNNIILSATILMVAYMLPVSCIVDFTQEDEQKTYPVEISMKTKSGAEDEPEKEYNETTYCFSLISTAQGTSGNLVSSGTYCDPKDDAAYLTACSVDANGDWTADDKACGLRASSTSATAYLMAAASPALPMVRIGETGYKYGYWYNRELDTEGGERRLFVSDAMDIQLYGEMARETPSSGSYAYIYKVPESKPLRERRSAMNIRLICGEELTDFTVGNMSVKNCMARAPFIPAVGAFDPQNVEYDAVGFDVEYSWPATVVSGDSLTVAQDISLLAADYSLVDGTGKNIYTPTVIHFTLGDDLDAPEYDLGLAFNIKPQYTYTVNITANTMHISVRVYAAEWGQKSVSGDIDAQPEFGDLVYVGEWSGGHGDRGQIGTNPDTDDVDFSTVERANCYILNPPKTEDVTKTFSIPVDRVNEFWGGNGYEDERANGYTIENDTEWEACVLWHDFASQTPEGLSLEKMTGTGPEETIDVALTSALVGEANGGNMVIGIRIKKGEDDYTPILWSWHLWITDYRPDDAAKLTPTSGQYVYEVPGGAVHRYDNDFFNTGIYEDKFIMDRNIGDYADHNYVDQGRGQLYYQFGRKDPFPGSNAIWINVGGTLVNKAWATADYAKAYDDSEVSGGSMQNVPYSVNNPLVFLTNSGAWTIGDKYNPSDYTGTAPSIRWQDPNILDDNGKSIFDPCPPGWRLPKNGTWTNFNHLTSGAYDLFVWNATDKGCYYYPNGISDQSTGRIYYPALGYRNVSSGGFSGGGSTAYYWSCSPYSAAKGYYLYFSSGTVNPSTGNNRAIGFSVRPVQE